MSTTSAKKLASLDALRGVAILLVIASHFGMGEFSFAGVMLANAGVILFFFLSGFLMDYTLSRDADPVSFAIRRAFRILPAYWLSLALAVAFGAAWTPAELLSNATFTAPLFGQDRMLGVYWTLYIEVLFYVTAPLLKLAGDKAISCSTYAALALFAAIAATHGIGKGAPFYVIFCLCGMQIGSWYRRQSSEVTVLASIAASSLGASLLLPVSIFLGVVPMLCASALFFCLRSDLRFGPLEIVGRVSYSWYLMHSIFGYKLSMPLGIAVTFALSVLTYYTIERPMILAGKHFIGR